MTRHLRYWIPRLTLFFGPLLLTAAAVVALAFHSGEAMPLAMIYAVQEADPAVVYKPRGRDTIFAYKLMGVERQRPAVLIVGSSRVLAIRRGFLTRAPNAFYNAGMEGAKLDDVARFVLQLTPATAPDILILGIDQYWFNDDYQDRRNPAPFMTGDLTPELWFRLTRRVVQDVLRGRIQIGSLISGQNPAVDARALGLNAIANGGGYRSDGSYVNWQSDMTPEDFRQMLIDAGQADRALVAGDILSVTAVETVESILDHAQQLGITVIGVPMPLAPEVYAAAQTSDQHGYLEQALTILPEVFDRYGQPYVDLTDPALLAIDPADMADAIHPSDRLSARIVAAIAERVPALLAHTDPDALNAMASRAEPSDILVGP
jgi:hypothetical protein